MKKLSNYLILILFYLTNLTFLDAQAPSPPTIEPGYSVQDGYIIYPSPDADYTNIIEVGPGQTYEEIHDIPVADVVPSTLVKIHHRAAPYQTKVFIDVIATETDRVRFQGIPNADGDLPVVSFENATGWGNNINQWTENLGVFVVYGTWGNKPEWIEIVNLHIKDAVYAGVWAKADHVSVKGCILENNPNGVFLQAANQLLIEISADNLIEGCKFTGNGTVGGYHHHNIYTQGISPIIQFNTIERVQDGSLGASLKDRSSNTIVRYNYIETSTRTIDLVEPEDTDQILTAIPNWDDAYVYGNLLLNEDPPVTGAGVSMIHYGYDNSPTYRREGTLFFENNTIVVDRNDGIWRVNLFDVKSNDAVVNYNNNILTATGMQTFYIFRSNETNNAGHIDFGASWISTTGTQNDWELTENPSDDYSMTGENNIITGSSPGFTDPASGDYSLTNSSPCLAVGEDLLTDLGLDVSFNSITTDDIGSRTDQSNPDLGTFHIAVPLPIELVSFNVHQEEGRSVLEWQTASELNNDHFEIQRSTDGSQFEILDLVQGAGSTNVKQNYTFIDNEPLIGINYYRLRQVDYNKQFTFSEIKSIRNIATGKDKLSFFPNPVSPNGQLTINSDLDLSEHRLIISDIQGKQVVEMVFSSIVDINNLSMNRGVYMIKIVDEMGRVKDAKRLIVTKE